MAYHQPDHYEIDAIRSNLVAKAERKRLAAAAQQMAVPPAVALQLCADIRQERAWYVPAAWVCKVCVAAGRNGVPARLNSDPSAFCRCGAVRLRYHRAG
jgi:hypothetical protein